MRLGKIFVCSLGRDLAEVCRVRCNTQAYLSDQDVLCKEMHFQAPNLRNNDKRTAIDCESMKNDDHY